jgi:hypothetical protein
LAGTNDLSKGGVKYKSSKYFMHEDYNKPSFHNDIGKIQILGQAFWNDYEGIVSF